MHTRSGLDTYRSLARTAAILGILTGMVYAPEGLAQPRGRSLPVFEVDTAWPSWNGSSATCRALPSMRRTTCGCSIGRARCSSLKTLPKGAPPVMVFDARQLHQGLGRPGAAMNGREREHGIHIDYKGSCGSADNNCPTNGSPGLKPVADDQLLKFTQDGKFVMQIGHSNQSKGNADTRNVHRAGRRVGAIRRPTNCSSPTATAITASSSSMPTAASSSGCGARSATSRWTRTTARSLTPKSFAEPTARRTSTSSTPSASSKDGTRLRGGSREPSRADVHQGRQVREAAGEDRHALRARSRAVARSGAAVPLCRRRQRAFSSSIARRSMCSAPYEVRSARGITSNTVP